MENRQIRFVKGFDGWKRGTFCFKTSHILVDDTTVSLTTVRDFFEFLSLGKKFPSEMIVSKVDDINVMLACTIFINPYLVLNKNTASLVYSFDLIDRWGLDVCSAHIPDDHISLALSLVSLSSDLPKSLKEEDALLFIYQASSLIETYLSSGNVPEKGTFFEKNDMRVILSEESFLAFLSENPLWEEVYNKGCLWGIWFSTYNTPVFFKKSDFVKIPFDTLTEALNEAEFGVKDGQGLGWTLEASGNVVSYPRKCPKTGESLTGTSLTTTDLVKIASKFT